MFISFIKKSQLYFIISFLVMIAAGTVLLKLPLIRSNGTPLEWIDALFVATSSICITGLLPLPLSSLNLPGQLLVLALIQLGGIGIMTLTTSVILMMGRQLSFGNTLLMSNISDRFVLRGTENLTRTVIRYALICEGIGFVLLLPSFWFGGDHSFLESFYLALYHAIAGFCNAGMSPLDGSLAGVPAVVKMVVALLIICGGLGVYAIYDLQGAYLYRRRLRAQTRLILAASAILLIGGMGLLWLLQYQCGNPISWVDAFFQSATARSCGYTAVPLETLSDGSLALLMVLMLIGGAPGSTAGGMKVTTVALAVTAIYNTFKGNNRVLLFHREIPIFNVLKAFVLILTYVLLLAGGTIMLQALTPCEGQWATFETVSALATVGLEIPYTDPLTMSGKIFLIFYMFLGRVGLFTFFLFLLSREHQSSLVYPEERVIVN